jgi:rhodanese-related sulfurtransferase
MNLSQQEWATQLENDKDAVIIDVRTEDECNEGIIPEAVNIDIYQAQYFVEKVEELDKTKNYYVYCKAGGRSEQACRIMNQMGIQNTYNLSGGMLQWNGVVVLPEK